MTKANTRRIGIALMLFAAALVPASAALAHASSDGVEDDRKNLIKDLKEEFKDRRAELKEQMREENKQRVIEDSPNTDRIFVQFTGSTNGWAIVNNTAHKSSIVLAGNVTEVGKSVWKIKAVGDLVVGQRTVDLDLSGHARGNTIHLYGTGTLGDDPVRIQLRGNYAPTATTNEYAVAFTNAGVKFSDSDVRVQLMHVGSIQTSSQ
jgi:hypothetical protein